MENIIICVILAIILAAAVWGSVKHFRGESGCCGGGSSSVKPPKKRLTGKVVRTYILSVEGMHCRNCANNVERAINRLDGAVAKVNLRKRQAKVCCDRDIDIETIKAAVEEKGYTIVSYQ